MRVWVTYLLGLTAVAIAVFGAYRVYSINAQTDCVCADHLKQNGTYRHALLRA